MKRSKDEDKDDVAVSSAAANNNNSTKTSNNASPNASQSSSSNDGNNGSAIGSGSGGTIGTVRTTGRVKKPKLVYDPSDNYISRGSRNSLPATTSTHVQGTSTIVNSSTNQAQSQPLTSQLNSSNQQQESSLSNGGEVAPQSVINSTANEEAKDPAAVLTAEQQRNFDTCMKCGKSEPKRGSGYKSNFLTCKTCTMKWHFNCLPITFETLTNARKKFKCERCRRCVYCTSTKSADKVKELIMCCGCANVYHLDCHWPLVKPEKLNDPKWKCYSCAPHRNLYNTHINASKHAPQSPPRKSKAGRKKRATSDPAAGMAKKVATSHEPTKNGIIARESSAASTGTENIVSAVPKEENDNSKGSCELETARRSSPQCSPAQSSPTAGTPIVSAPALSLSSSTEDKENGENTENKSPPTTTVGGNEQSTVQTWNVEEVVSYMERFYPREAGVFKSQEIDGAALMVLTRQDIIDRFGLKLGPALRIYELVLGLQTAIDDVTLAWCD